MSMTMKSSIRRMLLAGAMIALPLSMMNILPGVSAAYAQDAKAVDTSRLVSIGGDVTEIVYALGEQSRLIARDTTSTFPADANKIPDVGYMRALSPEGVLSANPTAIIAVEGSGPAEALAILQKAGIPFETVPEKYDRDGILGKIDIVGTFLGVPEKTKALHDSVAADLDAALLEAGKIPADKRKRVLFVLSMKGGKVMAGGTGTSADGILTLAGLTNAASAFQGYKAMTDESIIEAKPDIILMMDRGGDHGAANKEIFAQPAMSLTPAAATNSVVRMDGLHLLGFGPRTASAIRELNAAAYGKANGAE